MKRIIWDNFLTSLTSNQVTMHLLHVGTLLFHRKFTLLNQIPALPPLPLVFPISSCSQTQRETLGTLSPHYDMVKSYGNVAECLVISGGLHLTIIKFPLPDVLNICNEKKEKVNI